VRKKQKGLKVMMACLVKLKWILEKKTVKVWFGYWYRTMISNNFCEHAKNPRFKFSLESSESKD
jgi:hypothetical protein